MLIVSTNIFTIKGGLAIFTGGIIGFTIGSHIGWNRNEKKYNNLLSNNKMGGEIEKE